MFIRHFRVDDDGLGTFFGYQKLAQVVWLGDDKMHIFRANWNQVIEGLTGHVPPNDLALMLCKQMRVSKNPTIYETVNRWRRLKDGH